MDNTETIEIKLLVSAPREKVASSFTSSVAWENWFSDYAEVVPVKNGRFYVSWDAGHHASGIFKEIVENERLVFSWQGWGESKVTTVSITFQDVEGQTQINVFHRGLGTGGHWEHSRAAIHTGWETALENLKSVLETGLDKRLYERPMLGIYPNQPVDEDMAEKYNLPVSTGIQLGGVISGMGADAAGLIAEDVIFSLNKHELKTFSDFAQAIDGMKAGDVVEVVFFRDGIKQFIEMELSHRSFPEVPASAKALALKVADSYRETDKELEKILDGVSEEVASSPPEPGEWSAKEILVHLLYTEQWLHLAISCSITDQRPGAFANQPDLIKAMADFHSLADLVAELKQAERVTEKLMEALPDEFSQDKRKFIRFIDSIGQGFALHTRSHFPQLRAAIDAVT